MKPIYCLSILLFLIVNTGYGQVKKYKVFKSQKVYYDKDGNYVASTDWEPCDDLFVWNKPKNKVQIYSLPEDKEYDITQRVEEFEDQLDNNCVNYKGVDKKGIKCVIRTVSLKTPSGKHMATVYIDYSNMSYVFRLKDND